MGFALAVSLCRVTVRIWDWDEKGVLGRVVLFGVLVYSWFLMSLLDKDIMLGVMVLKIVTKDYGVNNAIHNKGSNSLIVRIHSSSSLQYLPSSIIWRSRFSSHIFPASYLHFYPF